MIFIRARTHTHSQIKLNQISSTVDPSYNTKLINQLKKFSCTVRVIISSNSNQVNTIELLVSLANHVEGGIN